MDLGAKASVLVSRMIYAVMAHESLAGANTDRRFVGHEDGSLIDISANDRPQRLGSHVRNME